MGESQKKIGGGEGLLLAGTGALMLRWRRTLKGRHGFFFAGAWGGGVGETGAVGEAEAEAECEQSNVHVPTCVDVIQYVVIHT